MVIKTSRAGSRIESIRSLSHRIPPPDSAHDSFVLKNLSGGGGAASRDLRSISSRSAAGEGNSTTFLHLVLTLHLVLSFPD